jgi:universal stress protein A
MPNISRVLAPIDFSPGSEVAAGYAGWLAGRLGARLRLLHVFTSPTHAASGVALSVRDDLAAANAQLRDQAERDIDALGDRLAALDPGGTRPETAVIEASERVPEAIARAATEARADLIVMSSHGRSGVRRMILGSTAESVLRTARCPVLIVK